MHRDEFRWQFGMHEMALPASLRHGDDGRVEPWLGADQINGALSLDKLILQIRNKR